MPLTSDSPTTKPQPTVEPEKPEKPQKPAFPPLTKTNEWEPPNLDDGLLEKFRQSEKE